MKISHDSGLFGIIRARKQKRSGDVTSIPEHGRTTLEVDGMTTVRIPLTQDKFALIDESDLPFIGPHKWHAFASGGTWYARRSEGKKNVYMHRLIMGDPAGLIVDHKNHDGLDNRRQNLRVCTISENSRNCRGARRTNPSGFIGVYIKANGRYSARIKINGKNLTIGCFDIAEDAARARDQAARFHFGEFAGLNFRDEGAH